MTGIKRLITWLYVKLVLKPLYEKAGHAVVVEMQYPIPEETEELDDKYWVWTACWEPTEEQRRRPH